MGGVLGICGISLSRVASEQPILAPAMTDTELEKMTINTYKGWTVYTTINTETNAWGTPDKEKPKIATTRALLKYLDDNEEKQYSFLDEDGTRWRREWGNLKKSQRQELIDMVKKRYTEKYIEHKAKIEEELNSVELGEAGQVMDRLTLRF